MSMLLNDLPGLAGAPPALKRRVVRASEAPVVAAPPAPLAYQRAFVQGWLEKKATWRFAWDRRYVVLDGDRLSYKLDEKKPEKGAGTVASLDCEATTQQFTVWLVEGGSWTLRAANQEQFNTWVEALLVALKCDPQSRSRTQLGVQSASSPPRDSTDAAASATDRPAHVDPETAAMPPSPASTGPNASITASMMLSPVVTPGAAAWSVPQLVAKITKKGAWTGVWKPRVMALYDGYQLEYKSTSEAAAPRTRYTISTVDGSFDLNHDRQLFFTTSNGERFWVQFRSRAECSVWYRTIRESLRLNCAWRWLPYPSTVNAEGWSQWFSASARRAYAAVESQYHAACTGPHPSICGSVHYPPKVLYVFGGSKEACRPTFQPAARSCIPFTTPANMIGDLRLLELGAANNAETVDIQPFQERQHAKIRPRGVIGASLSPITGLRGERGRLVLLGGTTGNVHDVSGATTTELWMAVIGATPDDDARRIRVVDVDAGSGAGAAATDDSTTTEPHRLPPPVWERLLFPNYELPQLTFHAAVSLDLLDEYLPPPPPVEAARVGASASTATLTARASAESLTTPEVEHTPHRSREEHEACAEDEQTPMHLPTPPRAVATKLADPTISAPALERPVVLFTGGLDVSFRYRNEVGAVVWPSTVQAARDPSAPPRAISLGFLPEARAFHKTTVLADGTVVLIGGRVLGSVPTDKAASPTASRMTVYTVGQSAWKAAVEAQLGEDASGRSPATPTTASLPWQGVVWVNEPETHGFTATGVESLSVVARGHEVYVLCAMQQAANPRRAEADDEGNSVKLIRLTFSKTAEQEDTAVRQVCCEEIDIVAGSAPPRTVGASLHFLRNSLYIVGATKRVDDEWSESVRYTILPPYRVLTD